MSRWIVLGVWVTVAFLAALFYGQLNFSARPLPQEYKVGVVLKAMDSEYWLAVRSRMENTAREKGMRLIVMAPENEAAYAEQEQIVRDLLAADVDALVIAPVDIDRADVYAGMAAERAVPLLTIDEKITDVPYIGSELCHRADGCGVHGGTYSGGRYGWYPRGGRTAGRASPARRGLSGLRAGAWRPTPRCSYNGCCAVSGSGTADRAHD